jgi:hypothetical protein
MALSTTLTDLDRTRGFPGGIADTRRSLNSAISWGAPLPRALPAASLAALGGGDGEGHGHGTPDSVAPGGQLVRAVGGLPGLGRERRDAPINLSDRCNGTTSTATATDVFERGQALLKARQPITGAVQ